MLVRKSTAAAVILSIPLSEWTALNASVGGRLATTTPMAHPCFSTYLNGNGENSQAPTSAITCSQIRRNTANSSFIADQPGGYITHNFGTCQETNHGCSVTTSRWLLGTNLPGTCYQGSVPDYFIDVRTAGDVAAGLAFAQKHSVPVVVKNTGHDYKGRSSAPNSLMLWTHNLRPPVQFSPEFQPDGCEDSTGPVLTYGAGQGFLGIYEAAHANGMMAVGGTSPTVGASGGWVTGGGHSALSPTHGLGVDNVVQMKAVLPNGTLITANRCQNQDLFFALRGGGGGTFGVLMETTSRVYPEVPLQHVVILAPSLNVMTGVDKLVELLVDNTPQWSADGWGGYMAGGGYGIGFALVDMITPKLTLEEAKISMKPILDYANSFFSHLSVPLKVEIKTEPNYWSYYNSQSAQMLSNVGVGGSSAMASRLIPKESFTAPKKAELIATLTDIIKNAPVPGGFLMVPPAQHELPATDQAGGPGECSLTPAWRNSYWHMLFQKSWSQGDEKYGGSGSALAAFNATTMSANMIRAITPEGAYQNEGDTFEPNPAESFWGQQNYDRLLRIKREVDPNNVLTCHQCIGWNPDDPRYRCYPRL